MSEHRQRLFALVAEKLGAPPEELRSETRLLDDLAADSLDLAELALALEDEFGVTLKDRDWAGTVTLGDLEEKLAS